MLRVLCTVKHDECARPPEPQWKVLRVVERPHIPADELDKALLLPGCTHVFASQTAVHLFHKLWLQLSSEQQDKLRKFEFTVCGVGKTTDQAAKTLQKQGVNLSWKSPAFTQSNQRKNGLSWTLEQLELCGMIPAHPLQLWTKKSSASEKILLGYKKQRQFFSWQTIVHALYDLQPTFEPLPDLVQSSLEGGMPVCFAAKSAEVLEAAVNGLIHQAKVAGVEQLSRSIYFSVWEKSAKLKANQLGLQSRLVEEQVDVSVDNEQQD